MKYISGIWDLLTLHNWHWLVMGLFVASCMLPEYGLLTLVLGILAVGLLLVAYLREGSSVRDREE